MDRKNWIKDKDDYKLCYIEDSFAYFTKISLSEQWGDDWDDIPYEHNAGEPYSNTDDQVIKVAYDGYCLETPKDRAGSNSMYSVEMINAKAVAWLVGYDDSSEKIITIQAGTNIKDFISKIEIMGGNVYVEV